MSKALDTCAVCPRLCRHGCPVAVGSGREAAVPATIAGVLRAWEAGHAPEALAREAATMCVDCGRCQQVCHIHTPLPEALRQARAELGVLVAPLPLSLIEGEAELVALETDARAWAQAFSAQTGKAVARWQTEDSLGAAGAGGPTWASHLKAIAACVGSRHVVTADGGAWRVLHEAGVAVSWLHEALAIVGATPSCACGAVACCGGAEPLRSAHPEVAQEMAGRWSMGQVVADSRCSTHLKSVRSEPVFDVIDRLLEAHP